jgi:Leucine-rich repeat (LRR) protein
MKQLLLICAVVALGCGKKEDGNTGVVKPNLPSPKAGVEEAIRKAAKKPTGELTETDLEKVRRLDLSFKKLTDVKGLENLTQLTFLNLSANRLTDVTGLEKLTQLRALDLDHNRLTDVKGLEKLTQLTFLNLSANRLTELPSLEKLNRLKTLRLWNNPAIPKTQIDQLQKALPKCKIYSNPTK